MGIGNRAKEWRERKGKEESWEEKKEGGHINLGRGNVRANIFTILCCLFAKEGKKEGKRELKENCGVKDRERGREKKALETQPNPAVVLFSRGSHT